MKRPTNTFSKTDGSELCTIDYTTNRDIQLHENLSCKSLEDGSAYNEVVESTEEIRYQHYIQTPGKKSVPENDSPINHSVITMNRNIPPKGVYRENAIKKSGKGTLANILPQKCYRYLWCSAGSFMCLIY